MNPNHEKFESFPTIQFTDFSNMAKHNSTWSYVLSIIICGMIYKAPGLRLIMN